MRKSRMLQVTTCKEVLPPVWLGGAQVASLKAHAPRPSGKRVSGKEVAYLAELRENWKRLKVSHKREGSGNGRGLKKERWTDGVLYIAQDACMAELLRVNRGSARYLLVMH